VANVTGQVTVLIGVLVVQAVIVAPLLVKVSPPVGAGEPVVGEKVAVNVT
jgi:hypothetical protein